MKIIKMFYSVSLFLFISNVQAAPITSLEISGGTFDLVGAIGTLNPAAFSSMTIDGYDGESPGFMNAPTQASYAPFSIATFQLGSFGPASLYTSDKDDVRSGFAPTSGSIINNTLNLDLSSLTFFWNGSIINVGSRTDLLADEICSSPGNCTSSILTSYNALTNEFTASWDAVFIGGAINGQVATLQLTGVVSAVPIPGAVWLMISGVIGLFAFSKKNIQ